MTYYLMSLCIQEDGICASTQGLLAAFHSHAMVTLATFLHVETNVVIRSGIFKIGVAASTISELGYNEVGIRFNVAIGYDTTPHGIASLFEIHYGLIKHYGLIGRVSRILLYNDPRFIVVGRTKT